MSCVQLLSVCVAVASSFCRLIGPSWSTLPAIGSVLEKRAVDLRMKAEAYFTQCGDKQAQALSTSCFFCLPAFTFLVISSSVLVQKEQKNVSVIPLQSEASLSLENSGLSPWSHPCSLSKLPAKVFKLLTQPALSQPYVISELYWIPSGLKLTSLKLSRPI